MSRCLRWPSCCPLCAAGPGALGWREGEAGTYVAAGFLGREASAQSLRGFPSRGPSAFGLPLSSQDSKSHVYSRRNAIPNPGFGLFLLPLLEPLKYFLTLPLSQPHKLHKHKSSPGFADPSAAGVGSRNAHALILGQGWEPGSNTQITPLSLSPSFSKC